MGRILPFTDQNGYYEIRLESIGGLGANLAGKLLGELGVLYMGLNASAFSSYGSEKRGSPVRAFIRYREGDREILNNAPVVHPQVLGVFHEAMASVYPVFAGIEKESRIVLNTALSASEAAEKYRISCGTLYVLEAGRLARSCNCRLNMVMIGAVLAASGFLSLEKMKSLCRENLGKKYPELTENNLKGLSLGYEAVQNQRGFFCGKDEKKVEELAQSPAGCGLDSMQEGTGRGQRSIGGVNPNAGNSVLNDLSASREGYVPVFHPEKCIHCGLCDTTCPDMVFQFERVTLGGKTMAVNRGPNYRYCKGCLRCVKVCPTAALTREEEAKARRDGWLEGGSFQGGGVWPDGGGAEGAMSREKKENG